MTVSKESVQQVPRELSGALDAAVEQAVTYVRTVDPDAAAELEEMRHRRVSRASVVVVGEPKRGKSSLVNALLGVPGLAPVGAPVATSAYLEFVPGPVAAAKAYVPGRNEPVRVPVAELADWASRLGRGVPHGLRAPRRVQVAHPAPLLRQVSLVDTPGVGGLDLAHAEVALDAAAQATALLYVADPSTPLTEEELDFLARASTTVGAVVFALAKVDAFARWRGVAEQNRALLRARVPGLASAPWFAVSARLAEQAVGAGPDAEQAVASGVAPLRNALTALATRGHEVQVANVLRSARDELVRLDADLAARLRAADPNAHDLGVARQARADLAGRRRTASREWSSALSAQTQRARSAADGFMHAELRAVQQQFADRIEYARGDDFEALPDDVDAALQAAAVRLSDDLQERFRLVGEHIVAQVFDDAAAQVVGRLNAALRHALSAAPARDSSDDNVVIAVSAGGIAFLGSRGAGFGASMLGAGQPAGLGVVVPFAGVGAGLAADGYVLWRHRVQTGRQQADSWLREVLDAARAALADEIAYRFTDLQYALTVAVDDAIDRRLRELDAHLGEIDAALTHDPATRAMARSAVQAERDVLRARVEQVDEMLVRAWAGER